MSYHVVNPEAQAQLAAQRRNSTITAIIIALLGCVLIALVLMVIALSPLFKETPKIVSYSAGPQDDEQIEKPEVTNQVERKPSAPSSSMAKVIAANTSSPTAVPVPDTEVTEPSLDFGNGNDFGDGWGSGDGSGGGGGGGGASFFKQKVKAGKICYVIDYSASMGGRRTQLLREELTRSIEGLPESMDYALIFFAGPAWEAGDTVTMNGHKSAEVRHGKRSYDWVNQGGNNWERKGSKQRVEWRKATKSTVAESVKAVQDTELVWGTTWNDPLEMALEMRPAPELIFFMTDGMPGSGNAQDTVDDIARKAKRTKTKINTIALMEPQARGPMTSLAEQTGGEFTLIGRDGQPVK